MKRSKLISKLRRKALYASMVTIIVLTAGMAEGQDGNAGAPIEVAY